MATNDPSDRADKVAGLDRQTLIAYALLTIAVTCWSGNWVIGRAIHVEVPPWGLTFWRWLVALVILLPIAGRQALHDWPVLRQHWKLLVALAISGTVLQQGFVYIGLQSTQAINALLLNTLGPAIFVAMSWVMLRELITRRQTAGMAVAFIGAMVIISRGDLATLSELRLNIGDFWILAATCFWGLYSILLRRLPADLPTKSLILAIVVIGLAVLAPAYATETLLGRPMPVSGTAVASILYTGAFPSVLAFFCWNIAVARVGANMAGFFLFLMPVIGTILAMIFLDERIFSYHLTGIVTVFAGIYFITSRRSARSAS